MHILAHQYDLIKQGRQNLFHYCETISQEHFQFKNDSFGGGSIQYLLVHIANTYTSWLGHFPMIALSAFAKTEDYPTMNEIQRLYNSVDELTEKFLIQFDLSLEQPITNKISSKDVEVAITPLKLFTHVTTHEFHHKGQILSMSRQLGYTPIDTDIIRFD